MENQITVPFIGYTFIILAAGTASGYYIRELLYNAVKNAKPKKAKKLGVSDNVDFHDNTMN